MPWSPAQHRLFEWAAHNPGAAHEKGYDISQHDARKMAAEGIRRKGRALTNTGTGSEGIGGATGGGAAGGGSGGGGGA